MVLMRHVVWMQAFADVRDKVDQEGLYETDYTFYLKIGLWLNFLCKCAQIFRHAYFHHVCASSCTHMRDWCRIIVPGLQGAKQWVVIIIQYWMPHMM